jgi:hypothetical protein
VNVFTGDVNTDEAINIADAISILGYLFARQAAPVCAKAADANDDDKLDIADAVKILGYLFSRQSMTAPDGTLLSTATQLPGCAPFGAEYIPALMNGIAGCATPCEP